jgi:hypothetical protein
MGLRSNGRFYATNPKPWLFPEVVPTPTPLCMYLERLLQFSTYRCIMIMSLLISICGSSLPTCRIFQLHVRKYPLGIMMDLVQCRLIFVVYRDNGMWTLPYLFLPPRATFGHRA